MKRVLGLANSSYFGFLEHIDDKTLNDCVHTMIVSIAFFTIIPCASTNVALRPMRWCSPAKG